MGGDNKHTIRLSSNSNVGILKSAPRYSQATTFILEGMLSVIPNPFETATCFLATEKIDNFDNVNDGNNEDATVTTSNQSMDKPDSTSFDIHDNFSDSNDASTFPEKALSNYQAELMQWHL